MNYNPYLEKAKKAKKGIFEQASYIPENTGRYDPNAPKFIYRRNFQGMTRKTSRVTKKTNPSLIGEISEAPSKTKGGSKYPYTKPMIGWERIFVGRGKFIKKGRSKKSRMAKDPLIYRPYKKGLKTSKPKFVEWSTTYGGYNFDNKK